MHTTPCEEFEEYSFVALTRLIQHNGDTRPAGTLGVIVHRHSDGIGYDVECETPTFAVLTLSGEHLNKHE